MGGIFGKKCPHKLGYFNGGKWHHIHHQRRGPSGAWRLVLRRSTAAAARDEHRTTTTMALSLSFASFRFSYQLPLISEESTLFVLRPGGRSGGALCMRRRERVSWGCEGVAARRGWSVRVFGCGGEETVGGHESEQEEENEEEEEMVSVSVAPERWDVLGLGQAMVDFSGMVDDGFLERLGIEKGTRKIVNHEERGRVLRAMDGQSYKAAAGGSLSNTLVALARLGGSASGGPPINVAMAGSVGSDPLGSFYRAKLCRANVHFLSPPIRDGTTGTVIVLTTPDAQRTMLAYQGTSSSVIHDQCLAGMISKTNILIVEGYLFEFPHTAKAIANACEDAHKIGALVAVTASDVSCIERSYDHYWEIVGNYADILFANRDEARALCQFSSKESPTDAARYLSRYVPLVSVTDGVRGSYIGVEGEVIYIPPSPCVPVDTCGAGDAYASGILYGILRGASDLKGIGMLASKVASVVVGQQGTRLRVHNAAELAESFAFQLESSKICSDIGPDRISNL